MKEIWKQVSDYEGLYEISNLGRVRNKKLKILKPNYIRDYATVILYNRERKIKRINRLVAEAFIPNINNHKEVNHIDGIKSNNVVNNLEWTTRSLNMKHAFKIGLANQKGSNHNRAKFSKKDIIKIKKLIKEKVKNVEIAKLFNCCPTLISHIKRGYSYAEE